MDFIHSNVTTLDRNTYIEYGQLSPILSKKYLGGADNDMQYKV